MNNVIKLNKPASIWEEAMPLGNGHIGAMVYGGIERETIQFNHDTFWSGCIKDETDSSKRENLQKVRELLFAGEYHKAEKIMSETMMGTSAECYLPIGFLNIRNLECGGICQDYKRELSLENAEVNVNYKRRSSRIEESCPVFKRKAFISYPHNVFVMRINGEKNEPIRLAANLESDVPYEITVETDTILMKGKAPNHMLPSYCKNEQYSWYDDNVKSVEFSMMLKVISKNGVISNKNNSIVVEDSDEVTFFVAIDTSFVSFDKEPVKKIDCASIIENALKDGYDKIYEEHIRDYQSLYNRAELKLFDEENNDFTSERLAALKNGKKDNGLTELIFNFGRYLMIAGSRKGSEPTNLFGIWSGLFRQQWQGNFTVNINTEMNYWAAEVCNLAECHEPLLRFTEELSVAGEKTAREHFGCGGFCANHNIDLWRHSLPIQTHPTSGYWPMAGGWFVRHLWEHYQYNQDKNFLESKVYPITKKAAEFFIDWLVPNENGYLVTAPSTSPENNYYDKNKNVCGVSIAATMDMSIIKEVFGHIIEMSAILGITDDFTEKVKEMYEKLYPFIVLPDGTLSEWFHEFEDVDPGHRHLSHLYGLYPAELITKDTPDLFSACEKSLRKRIKYGGGATGWSGSWIICLFARLGKGSDCASMLDKMLKTLIYDNLLDSHPPFQIDGNFGLAAGICEMLLQSHNNEIVLLPAKSDDWQKGEFSGLRARGGYEVSAKWNENCITYYSLKKDGKIIEEKSGAFPFGLRIAQRCLERNLEIYKKQTRKAICLGVKYKEA